MLRPLRLSPVLGVLLVLPACSSGRVPARAIDAQSSHSIRPLECAATAEVAPATQVIGPAGGTLQAPGGHRLRVPVNGVSEPTTFTMYRAHPRFGIMEVNADKPIRRVHLLLSYRDCVVPGDQRDSVYIARLNADSTWTRIGGTRDSARRTVEVELQSLSPYAIASN